MKLIKHPLSTSEPRLKDTYMVAEGEYKGTTFEITDLQFGEENEITFNLTLIVLLQNEKEVRDIFLINHHFVIIQKEVSAIIVEALTAFVDSQKDKEIPDK